MSTLKSFKAFQFSAEWLFPWEGGYVDDPKDRGGKTKYGISQRAYPHLDIESLTCDQAQGIYFRDYWKAARCHELPSGLSHIVFDAAVNHGAFRAQQMLQELVGAKPDGIIGPATLSAVASFNSQHLIARYGVRRSRLYGRICRNNSEQFRFYEGWLNRLASCVDAAFEIGFSKQHVIKRS